MPLKLQPLLLLKHDPHELLKLVDITALLHRLIVNLHCCLHDALGRLQTDILDARLVAIERIDLLHELVVNDQRLVGARLQGGRLVENSIPIAKPNFCSSGNCFESLSPMSVRYIGELGSINFFNLR
jgi:hypothetical protein